VVDSFAQISLVDLVTFEFASLRDLWDFSRDISIDFFEVNIKSMRLTCRCTEQHKTLATTKFKARIVPKDSSGSTPA